MIWQNNVKKIVMLTNLEESGKVINLYFLVQFLYFLYYFVCLSGTVVVVMKTGKTAMDLTWYRHFQRIDGLNQITYYCIEYTPPWAGFKLTTLVVIVVMLTNLEESGKVINLYFLVQFLYFLYNFVCLSWAVVVAIVR
jgi:glucan phosphoethanolaminetransferase (alkaline phosphatase superfamily)